ncbi:hypothetical protein WB401_36390 [Streptomyces brasiliscabiei]|uniref:Uncharacterized protein n=1 Tax=Streptomyces brasiliscabiei TaxID=2736302 RepID=A0ABU8GN66_9ACTN
MPRPTSPDDWTVFLAELHDFFETCGEEVDDASPPTSALAPPSTGSPPAWS